MHLAPDTKTLRYREKVAELLRQGLPADWAGVGALEPEQRTEFMAGWREFLRDHNLIAPHWPSEYGGAPLLGVKGCCVIGHGRSNPTAIKHGIRTAAEFYRSGVNAQIAAELRALGARKDAAAPAGTA